MLAPAVVLVVELTVLPLLEVMLLFVVTLVLLLLMLVLLDVVDVDAAVALHAKHSSKAAAIGSMLNMFGFSMRCLLFAAAFVPVENRPAPARTRGTCRALVPEDTRHPLRAHSQAQKLQPKCSSLHNHIAERALESAK